MVRSLYIAGALKILIIQLRTYKADITALKRCVGQRAECWKIEPATPSLVVAINSAYCILGF